MINKKKKVGFLYFEEIHHIPHFIGIATELSNYDDYSVEILTYKNSHEYLFKLIDILDAENIIVKQLKQPFIRRIIDTFTGRKKPSPIFFYKKHKKLLLDYDALVFTEKNHKYIYNYRKKEKKPYLISVNHGAAGGRGYSFRKIVKLFDLNLIGGGFYLNRLKEEDLLVKNHAVIGYSKFDVVLKSANKIQLFKSKKPIVLYNPHFNKLSSSWYKHGLNILEYFYNSKEYNLIFAPHMYLFNRKGFENKNVIDEKYFNKENIYIDLGSIRSSDMTYVMNSDIYLGDVSSQVSEFQIKPRPCIFINTNNVMDWKNHLNYRSWHTGDVIESVNELESILKNINTKKEYYLKIQEQLFKENFLTDKNQTASQKGALAIDHFITNKI